MKKIFFAFVAFVFGIAQANAQSITFENVSLPEKGQAELVVNYSTGGKTIVSYGFSIKLPEGLSFVMTDGEPNVTYEGGKGVNLTYKDGNFGFLPKNDEVQITGEGVLLKLTLQAGENLKQNDEFEVEVTSLGMTDSDLKDVPIANTQFTVKIVENRITLDETVGITSETPTGTQNVLVKRTISANNNWNTICLPFAMTGDQVVEAFGEGVKFANFNGYVYDEDNDELKVNFVSFDASAGLEANHPCLIQVNNRVTEFRVDNVTVEPDEAIVAAVKRTKKQWSEMIGTYEPMTLGEDGSVLFISGNNFYYANPEGKTRMKAFRAYFDFYDELENKAAAAKVGFNVDGEATSIDGYAINRSAEGVYDLSGRKIQLKDGDLNKLQKGVYIIDGKKVTIK